MLLRASLVNRRCSVQALAIRLECFVDARTNSSDSASSLFISRQELASRLGHADAAGLRAAGLNARVLAGGFKRGEDGVDSVQEIAHWRSTQLPTIAKAQP